LDDRVFNDLCYPWRDALTVKLLGKSIGFTQMNLRLKQSWRLSVGFDLLDVGHGFFMVKFDHEYPRMIFVHYLTVRLWSPSFLLSITRICIEVDLDKPVAGKVWIQDLWYKVEYEGLHTIFLQFMWVLRSC
jgi:hypothetical protein